MLTPSPGMLPNAHTQPWHAPQCSTRHVMLPNAHTQPGMLPVAPEEFHFLCVSLAVYASPQLFAGMTQKQIAEAVHLKHFSDQRLEREARIRERWGWRCTHRHIQGVLAAAFQRPCAVARLEML